MLEGWVDVGSFRSLLSTSSMLSFPCSIQMVVSWSLLLLRKTFLLVLFSSDDGGERGWMDGEWDGCCGMRRKESEQGDFAVGLVDLSLSPFAHLPLSL